MPEILKVSNGETLVTITKMSIEEAEHAAGLTREVKQTFASIVRFLLEDSSIVAEHVPVSKTLKVFLPEHLSFVDYGKATDLVREVCWHHNASACSLVKREEKPKGDLLFFSLEFDFTTELGSRFAERMGVTEEGCEALNTAMEQTAQRVADKMALRESGIEIISN